MKLEKPRLQVLLIAAGILLILLAPYAPAPLFQSMISTEDKFQTLRYEEVIPCIKLAGTMLCLTGIAAMFSGREH